MKSEYRFGRVVVRSGVWRVRLYTVYGLVSLSRVAAEGMVMEFGMVTELVGNRERVFAVSGHFQLQL